MHILYMYHMHILYMHHPTIALGLKSLSGQKTTTRTAPQCQRSPLSPFQAPRVLYASRIAIWMSTHVTFSSKHNQYTRSYTHSLTQHTSFTHSTHVIHSLKTRHSLTQHTHCHSLMLLNQLLGNPFFPCPKRKRRSPCKGRVPPKKQTKLN